MSNVKPCAENTRARPPAIEFFSKISTSYPRSAKEVAVDNPEKPAPITSIFFFFIFRQAKNKDNQLDQSFVKKEKVRHHLTFYYLFC